jgi:hypothetical protein
MTLRWRLVLPIVQLILTFACWFYEPIQYRKIAVLGHNQDRWGYLGQSYPAPVGRFSYIDNFPAYIYADAMSNLLYSRGMSFPAWRYEWHGGNEHAGFTYTVGLNEDIFFLGGFFLWYWVGGKIDGFIQKPHIGGRPKRRVWQVIEMLVVLGTGAYLLFVCIIVLATPKISHPYRQIATFGLIWPVALLAYFCFRLWQELHGPRKLQDSRALPDY